MGKKKVVLFLLLSVLSNIDAYCQELRWREKNELTLSLYHSLEDFANENAHVKIELPSIHEVGFLEYLNNVLTKKEKERIYSDSKRIKQQEAKNFLKTHFVFHDTVPEFVFSDIGQMLNWGKSFSDFSVVQSNDFSVGDSNIFILMVDKCSGLRCLSIYVFEQKDEDWKLITGTDTNITENIIVKAYNDKKIVFETSLNKIADLSF